MMNDEFIKSFEQSLKTGFIDKSINSEILYLPELIINKNKPRTKVLTTILNELENCESFLISVAFVTTSGVSTLMNSLIDLEEKGVKGKILVSQYLNFTQPEALKKLLQFNNVELRIATSSNSHSKGYIFKNKNYYNLIVGSSNLTDSALTKNKEWNLKVSAIHSSEIVDKVIGEFENDFNQGTIVSEEYIKEYESIYQKQLLNYQVNSDNNKLDPQKIMPNSMQIDALKNLKKLREEKKQKALLISATGTGKTYLSAFDAKEVNPKKLLFVVHRLNIAKKALETFKTVFGKSRSMGLFSGNKRELDKDFIFSTIQTISRENHLNQFKSDFFDYIIIDESHRTGADSYLRLMEHFNPDFLLGMTATPERTDGNDIFSLFDHNIAYEIRLSRAMEEDMLSPFHYFGVTDLSVDNKLLENDSDFNLLTANERVEKIISKANLYGCDNGIIRGLIFCSRNEEAKMLSEKFNNRGFKTIALSGENTEDERLAAIEKLESDNINEKIDYIFTVDIFNEGIDIPKLNQIIMIRPTDSAIIFIQQLGRGLRKTKGKNYVTIIDFIGNYNNNYLIPIALYGDTSYNKDSLRKLISEGSKMIPGTSTINFDKITKERIFKSIDSANMGLLSDLKKDYNLMKYRLGHTPMMTDFLVNESRDPFLFIEYSKSYYNFVVKVDKDFTPTLNKELIELLELFSREINNAKRIEESFILKELIHGNKLSIDKLKKEINTTYGYTPTVKTIESCVFNLNFEFLRKNKNIIIIRNGILMFHNDFLESLEQLNFRNFLLDSTNYSIKTFNKNYKKEYFKKGLILYNKYSRKDVCRLLNWDKDISATVYGYRTKENITPCFVTYNKSHEIEDSINYNDYFVNPSVFAWESRSNRKIESKEIQNVINSSRILLFIKKEDGEGTDFYFMGDCTIIPNSIEQAKMPDSQQPVVHFKFKLDEPVNENLYKYITSNNNIVNEVEKEENTKSVFTIPLYDFYAAAGSFSEMQSEKNYSMLEIESNYDPEKYFACKVVGESMNKIIPNNSICLFKKYSGGSRSNKIVLVENFDFQDPDFNSSFTVKTYISSKVVTEEGWAHQSIILKPNSFDNSFKEIVINEDSGEHMKVIGEFIKVLKT